ncbi:MAG: hypothetical protein J5518_08905 [Lachnospiraceae bacterium]|nr:hypothetical protein [Lachnospiraceae bacterium]
MNTVKINFSDFWDGFDPLDNFITDALREHFLVELSDKPDFVFCSNFGNRHLKYKCVKIYYTGENLCPDFNLVDYAMGFQPITFTDRYLRLPLYVLYPEACQLALSKHELPDDYDPSSKKFCNYVISNAISDPARDEMISVLNSYKSVDSGGRYKNNVGGPVPDKIAFERDYKFTMCFENTSALGYTTEKLMEAFAGGTVPIYWGNPDIASEFNPDSFINCHDFASFEEVLTEVKKIDNDPDLFLKKLRAPILSENSGARVCLAKDYVSDYLCRILSQKPEEAFRRNRIYIGKRYEDQAAFHRRLDGILYLPRRAVFSLQNRFRRFRHRK